MRPLKKFVAISMISLLSNLTLVPFVHADDTPTKALVKPMKQHQVAPFDGVLMNHAAVATIIAEKKIAAEKFSLNIKQCHEVERKTCDFRVKGEETRCGALTKTRDDRLNIQYEQNRRLSAELSAERSKREKAKSNTYWWAAGGAGVGVVFTLLTVFAVGRITR